MSHVKYILVIAGLLLSGYFFVDSQKMLQDSILVSCPTENIDWDIAIQALTEYQRNSSFTDFGPADIERHFQENCEEDMEIYNVYLLQHNS